MLLEIPNKISNWEYGSPQFVRLWNMITYCLQPLCKQLCGLQEREDVLKKLIDDHPDAVPSTNLNENLIEKFRTDLSVILEGLETTGLLAAPKLLRQIIDGLPNTTFIRLHENIKQSREMIIGELKEVLLIFIPRDKSIWLKKEHVVVEQFSQSFHSALDDLKESLFCYVAGRYTAAVFHSMRILEYGLKALAKDIDITFDIQQWYNIINEIEAKIKEISKTMPKGDAKNERLQFLSEAAKEFTYFKDGWRNYVSHNRSKYDGPQALSAINHVKAFMVHLSTRLAE
jgi:hypothetical protein